MKKTHFGIILILVISFVSCNEKKITELNNRISELEILNKKLTDSISKTDFEKVLNSNIIGFTAVSEPRVNEECEVKFIFNYSEKLPEYNVYSTTENGEPDELIYSNLNDNEFKHKFIPKKAGKHNIKLVAVFKLNNAENEEIHIPTNLFVEIKK